MVAIVVAVLVGVAVGYFGVTRAVAAVKTFGAKVANWVSAHL